jgi:hypothetical protein
MTEPFKILFQKLNKNDLFTLVYELKKMKLKIGDYVYKKGDNNNGIYLIKKGIY